MTARFAALLLALACSASAVHAQSGRTPVAARDLARGAVLTAVDIAWSDSAVSRLGARDSVEAGWVVHRTLRAGDVLEPPDVSPPDLVTSGDVVNVIYTAPGVAITLRGTVVGSGARGDEVYVRLDDRRRLRGVVAAANTVRVM